MGKHFSHKHFSNKHFGKKSRRGKNRETAEIFDLQGTKFEAERILPPIKPLNPTQADYLDALRSSPQVIVLGPAGTGKTWIAATHAADLFRTGAIDKMIEAIKERIGTAAYEIALKNGAIEMVPFEVMRGRSWKNAFVLFDEAQNSSVVEIKTFLTRIGEDCTVVINGDVSQCDLDHGSGLKTVIHMVKSQMLNVPVVEFSRDDIVRSGVCAMWVRAFDEAKL